MSSSGQATHMKREKAQLQNLLHPEISSISEKLWPLCPGGLYFRCQGSQSRCCLALVTLMFPAPTALQAQGVLRRPASVLCATTAGLAWLPPCLEMYVNLQTGSSNYIHLMAVVRRQCQPLQSTGASAEPYLSTKLAKGYHHSPSRLTTT